MKTRYTATALAEIAEILSFVSRDNQNAADELGRAIERTVALISSNPTAAPVVHQDNVRSRRAGRYHTVSFMLSRGAS